MNYNVNNNVPRARVCVFRTNFIPGPPRYFSEPADIRCVRRRRRRIERRRAKRWEFFEQQCSYGEHILYRFARHSFLLPPFLRSSNENSPSYFSVLFLLYVYLSVLITTREYFRCLLFSRLFNLADTERAASKSA